jgi:hypothetical protein
MKCDLLIQDETIERTVDFFTSIGFHFIRHLLSQDKNITVNIEFIDTPTNLKIYSLEENPKILCISEFGISFFIYLTKNSVLATENGDLSGFLFCPMTNIKSIDLFGGLSYKNISNIT